MKRGPELREALFISGMVVLASVLGIWGRGLGLGLYIGLLGLVALAGVVLVVALRLRRPRTEHTVSFLHVPAEDPAQRAVVAGVHYPKHEIPDPQFRYEWQLNSNADGSVVGALHHHEEDLVGAELIRELNGGLWAKCQCGADTGVPDRLPTRSERAHEGTQQ